ncbi:hypothetical protein DFH05DRAFT_774640 [Lentinula detonsa]|uniref:Uncharacterized protein n=1 Tax=Lentinula detonsa TaxID=2804962 RepID=A0A9W8P533_9AGAR|nr:hypothetical protein DFH05DRAFT_774640 [Lentinula detonsa]
MAMAGVNPGKRSKDAGRETGRNTGKDQAREAIETSLSSFSREVYRTLDAKQAEIQRLIEVLQIAENDSRELTTAKATLENTSNRLNHTIEALAKAEEQLKVANESLKEAYEARKSTDNARNAAEDSRKDALSQRDWFKVELDRIRVEATANLSDSQTLLDEAIAELDNLKIESKSMKVEYKEAQNELADIRREKDVARNERDRAVKMLHQAQLETEEWKTELEKREEEVTQLRTQLSYWKDQARNWHGVAVDSTRNRSKVKSESTAAAAAPLTPASASGSGTRRKRRIDDDDEDEDNEADVYQGRDISTTPEYSVQSQRRRESAAVALSNTSTQKQRAGKSSGINQESKTPKAPVKTPQSAKLSSTFRIKPVPSTPSAYPSKLANSRNAIPSSSSQGDDITTESSRRGRRNGENRELQNRETEGRDGTGHGYASESETGKSLSSLVYPIDPDPHVIPRSPKTPRNSGAHRTNHNLQNSHDERSPHPNNASISLNAKTTHSRVVRRIIQHRFVLDVKQEEDETGLVDNGHGAPVNDSNGGIESHEDVYDGDELQEENDDDRRPISNFGQGKGKAPANENRSWDLFDDQRVVDGPEIEERPLTETPTGVGPPNPQGRGRGTARKTGRVKRKGRGGTGPSRSRSRLKPKHDNEDDDLDGEGDFDSDHDGDDDDKVEYRRPPQRSRNRPSYPSSSPVSSEDELMITSRGIGGIDDPPGTMEAADVLRTPHHDSRILYPSSSRKRPPTPLASSTSDGGAGSTASRKRRKR